MGMGLNVDSHGMDFEIISNGNTPFFVWVDNVPPTQTVGCCFGGYMSDDLRKGCPGVLILTHDIIWR